jgi:transposase
VRERQALKRYLDELESADAQDEVVIDPSAVAAALEKLKKHSEPEAGFMRTGDGTVPAYHVQTAVDAEHALIVVQKVTRRATTLAVCSRWRKPRRWPWASLRG